MDITFRILSILPLLQDALLLEDGDGVRFGNVAGNLRFKEAEARGLRVQGSLGLDSETLGKKERKKVGEGKEEAKQLSDIVVHLSTSRS